MRISASTARMFAVALALGAVLVSAANPAQPAARLAEHANASAAEASGTRRTVIGLHVPWAVGGLRIERDGSLRQHPGEWPVRDFQRLARFVLRDDVADLLSAGIGG